MPAARRKKALRATQTGPISSSAVTGSSTTTFEISHDDRLRIIEQSGILSKVPSTHPAAFDESDQETLIRFTEEDLLARPGLDEEDAAIEDEDTLPPWVDAACDTFMFLIPFTTLFIVMDILVHRQYGQSLTPKMALTRSLNFVPGLALVIHYTLRRPTHRLVRLLFLLLSTVGGSIMIRMVNRDSYLQIMRRCPALGTLWVYSIVRMELADAVVSLAIVGLVCWYSELKIIF